MAIESVANGSRQAWRATFDHESPIDTFERKLTQAESLAKVLCGEGGRGFRCFNDAIQDNVQWLLSDLITESRIAYEQAEKEPS